MRQPTFLLCLMLVFSACSSNTQESANNTLPVGDYADYQVSDNTDTLESYPPWEEYTYLPTVLSSDEHAATVYALAAQTTLKVPLGWYAEQSPDTARFMLEDQKTRFTLGFRSLEGKTFEELKNSYAEGFKSAYPSLSDENINLVSISDTQFYIEVRNLMNTSGTENGIVNVITYNPDLPNYYHSLLLVTPNDTFEHYEGLVGLIVRDQEIDWTIY